MEGESEGCWGEEEDRVEEYGGMHVDVMRVD